ncbi:MAG TPA: glycosyltransferase family 4 protein [Gemmataceae bacterium]|jgi:UDP-glucose:(heptosyl)LPS alpha-1,3-glucosyltransferase|nr:glycosyltransferase family 4 protein [Gemmataceae bacterium]
MNIALCYQTVLPARGGCETYIAGLARRLAADGHGVHLYACLWDAAALPAPVHCHPVPVAAGPRFLRPWRFASACARALRGAGHDVSVGFDKIWGQDVMYPQGGLHAASVEHNLLKYRHPVVRGLARLGKALDVAHWSFARLERRQYLGPDQPLVVAISQMVGRQFQHYYGMDASRVRVVPCATDTTRFNRPDRPRLRLEWRRHWGIGSQDPVGLFISMNYRLKGLEPLLHAVRRLPPGQPFRLLVAGNPKTDRYERLAHRLGIAERVKFVGPCHEIERCYFVSDFLVHPTFYDAFSLVVLEALACGLPVITTANAGASELLHPPRDGYVIADPHDHERLAWCMLQLLDPTRRAACAQAARQAAGRWTFEHHYQQMLHIFAEAAARKQAA